MTTGAALQLVGLFGLAYATDSHLPGISPMAAVSIFIDGTKDILPTTDSQDSDRMRGALSGDVDQCELGVQCGNNVYIDYPREFGIMTGLGSQTYEDSKAVAAAKTKAAIIDAVAQNPGDPVYVVGFSQGSNAASDVLAELEAENAQCVKATNCTPVDYSKVTFVLLGNGARNDGGLWARMPAGVYVPLIGLRFGASTNPASPSYAGTPPQVIQISKQYDGASDVPKYVLNPLAAANAALGFIYVHNGYYSDVNMDLNNDSKIDEVDVLLAQDDSDNYIVTTNGNVTDIVILNRPGDLPLTRPLLDLGVPREVVEALDPLLRAIIETGYDRAPNGGTYAATPVHFQLAPGQDQWVKDFQAIAAGMAETEKKLAELNAANLNPAQQSPEAQTNAASVTAESGQASQPSSQQSSQQWPQRSTPGWPVVEQFTPATQPPALSQTATEPTTPPDPELSRATSDEDVTTPTKSKPQVNLNKSLQQINKAITGTVKSVVGALTPKPRSGGTTTTSDSEQPGSESVDADAPSTDPATASEPAA